MSTRSENHASTTTTHGSCHCGAVHWKFHGAIPDATICNCTVCRRYGALWAYDYDGQGIELEDKFGALRAYTRGRPTLSFNFCSHCGNLVSWRALKPGRDGLARTALNLRLADPDDVAGIRLQRFDGLHSFEDLPPDTRTVADVWF
ncbi:GFA family protein [Rhizobium grahamii]|uniref:CENP-V/GFA domain-containing protein n=1 Tax=Rhizobium grahamii CCGE 502 TaxID=990285 RepID=S3H8I3_9HYPH|nr:hypothetical protein [Rhizobium grahamii]EPE94924.1 hypothetical protein RGCCGE502_30518 [Rhizobium grahamii CCGE 502]